MRVSIGKLRQFDSQNRLHELEAFVATSRLQDPFMREYAATFKATHSRVARRVAESPPDAAAIMEDELRGLYHGLLVMLDGGSRLADEGLLSVVDEDGDSFDRFLHEICFRYWPKSG